MVEIEKEAMKIFIKDEILNPEKVHALTVIKLN
jgi:hypothetical protein